MRRAWLAGTAALIAICAIAHPAHAQMPNLIDLSAEYTPPANLERSDLSRLQISSYQVALSVPIPLSPRQFLIPGLTYHVDSTSRVAMQDNAHDTFHAPEASLMFIQLMPQRWSITVRGAASVAGSYDTIDRRMIAYSGMLLAAWSPSDQVTAGAGMIVTGGFGQLLPLPALTVRWQPRQDLRIDMFVPAFAALRYTVWDGFELGARTEFQGHTYAYRGADACTTPRDPTSSDLMTGSDGCLDHVRYTMATTGVVGGVRLTDSVWLTAYAGTSVYRRGEELDRDDHQLPGASHTLPRVLFFRTNVAWRLPGS